MDIPHVALPSAMSDAYIRQDHKGGVLDTFSLIKLSAAPVKLGCWFAGLWRFFVQDAAYCTSILTPHWLGFSASQDSRQPYSTQPLHS